MQPVFGAEGFTIDVVELLAVDGSIGLTSSFWSAKAVMMVEAIFVLRELVGLILLELVHSKRGRRILHIRCVKYAISNGIAFLISVIDKDGTVRVG